jgi:hypothetical protein
MIALARLDFAEPVLFDCFVGPNNASWIAAAIFSGSPWPAACM